MQSVKFVLEKRTEKAGISVNEDSLVKAFSLATDLTKPFEYLLATGNLRSKTGKPSGLRSLLFFPAKQNDKQLKTDLLTENPA